MDSARPQDWLALAEEDLAVAQILVHHQRFAVAAFHIQQAAEKAIKAVLVAKGVRPVRTHDLGLLLALAGTGDDLPVELDFIDDVTTWAAVTRYPADEPLGPEPLDVEQGADAVANLLDWARGLVQPAA